MKEMYEQRLCDMHDWVGIESSLDRTYLNGWFINKDIDDPLNHLLRDFSKEDVIELANKCQVHLPTHSSYCLRKVDGQ